MHIFCTFDVNTLIDKYINKSNLPIFERKQIIMKTLGESSNRAGIVVKSD